MCLLSVDSWTKPDVNPSSPPHLPFDLCIGLSKHSDFFTEACKISYCSQEKLPSLFWACGPEHWPRNLTIRVLPSEYAFSWLTAKFFPGACSYRSEKETLSICTSLTSLCSRSVLLCHMFLNLFEIVQSWCTGMMTAVSYMAGLMMLPGLTLPRHLIILVPFSTDCYFLLILTAAKEGLVIKQKYRFPLQSYLE